MRNKIKWKEVFRFLIIGGIATLIDFIVYFWLSQFIPIMEAKTISMIVSCTYAFFMNKVWTFEVGKKNSTIYIVKYMVAQGVNIGINVSINMGICYIVGNKLIAYIIDTGIAMICNFCMQKFFVFK